MSGGSSLVADSYHDRVSIKIITFLVESLNTIYMNMVKRGLVNEITV